MVLTKLKQCHSDLSMQYCFIISSNQLHKEMQMRLENTGTITQPGTEILNGLHTEHVKLKYNIINTQSLIIKNQTQIITTSCDKKKSTIIRQARN